MEPRPNDGDYDDDDDDYGGAEEDDGGPYGLRDCMNRVCCVSRSEFIKGDQIWVYYPTHELRKVLFLALSVTFLFVYEISRERGTVEGLAPHSQGGHVWSIARTSLKVKVNFGGLRAVYVWKTSLL